MRSEIRFYLSIILRRLPLIVLVAGLLSAGAVIYAMMLPNTFRAEALLLVESPQIPGNLAESTVSDNAPEQLEIIQQRLLTRENLIDIASDKGVFSGRTDLVPDDVVDLMRSKTRFSSSFGRDRPTLMTISFSDQSAEVTASVVNEYVTRVLQESVEFRTRIAEQTLDFFEQEVQRLSEELDRQSAKILDFKNSNADALPEGEGYRLTRQSMLLERRSQIERDKASLSDQKERLVQLYNATGGAGVAGQVELTPEQKLLNAAQSELNAALLVYSDTNPRVKVLKARVEQLERQVAESMGVTADDKATAANPNEALLNLQLAEIDSRTKSLDDQMASVDAELSKLQDAIARTPGNAIALQSLDRDYENIQARYNAAVARLATAATGERIELTSKGQRISVLRQAVVPRDPASPNRPAIMAAGIAASLGAAIGLVVLLELLNRAVRRPVDLTRALGITPLATVPYIAVPGEVARRRGLMLAAATVVAVGVPAALYYVHMEYMPLDLIADRALNRLGL